MERVEVELGVLRRSDAVGPVVGEDRLQRAVADRIPPLFEKLRHRQMADRRVTMVVSEGERRQDEHQRLEGEHAAEGPAGHERRETEAGAEGDPKLPAAEGQAAQEAQAGQPVAEQQLSEKDGLRPQSVVHFSLHFSLTG